MVIVGASSINRVPGDDGTKFLQIYLTTTCSKVSWTRPFVVGSCALLERALK